MPPGGKTRKIAFKGGSDDGLLESWHEEQASEYLAERGVFNIGSCEIRSFTDFYEWARVNSWSAENDEIYVGWREEQARERAEQEAKAKKQEQQMQRRRNRKPMRRLALLNRS